MKDGFDMSEIDELIEDLQAIEKNRPKAAKSFIRKEGTQLKNKTLRKAKSTINKEKTGNYIDSIKRGEPYLYKGHILSIRAFNSAPHAHLIENGHLLTSENGKEIGYVKGRHIFEKAINEFQPYYHKHCRKFVDDVFSDGGWR